MKHPKKKLKYLEKKTFELIVSDPLGVAPPSTGIQTGTDESSVGGVKGPIRIQTAPAASAAQTASDPTERWTSLTLSFDSCVRFSCFQVTPSGCLQISVLVGVKKKFPFT